jgi:hypothetical protein
MKTLRAWVPVFVVLALFAAPVLVEAQIVPQCGLTSANDLTAVNCNLCHLGQLMQNIIDFLIYGFAIPLAAAMFAYAGVLYFTAGSSPSRITKATSIFKNVGIGFLIAISGWLVINTILTVAFDRETFFYGRSWFEIECVSKISDDPKNDIEGGARIIGTDFSDLLDEVIPDAVAPPPPIVYIPVETNAGWKGGCPQDSIFDPEREICIKTGGDIVKPVPIDGKFDYQSGIEAQVPHASAALSNMLNCMAARLPSNVGEISSISDSDLVPPASKTWAQCRAGGQSAGCAHTVNSYHYGGATCGNQSYAVDFGDEQNALAISQAAQQCGGRALNEGNHVHVSIGSCGVDGI